jgi:hypothetical protein
VVALVLAIARGESAPLLADLGWSVAGGLSGGIGVSVLYQGLAVGRMVASLVGPVGPVGPVGGRS